MKKLLLGMIFMSLSLCLIGCNFTEDLYLNNDGSGKISINFDGSELMKIGGDKIAEGKEEVVDSMFVFKDFLEEKRDSISQLPEKEQQRLKRLENFRMHMVMNAKTKEMNFDMYSDFKNVSELGDIFNDFQTASTVSNPSPGVSNNQNSPLSMSATDSDGYNVNYSFEKNKFKRVAEIIDSEKLKQSLDSLEQIKPFLVSSKYKLNYHFPRKIKKISSEKALFSQDGKSFTLEVGFIEYMANPKILDVEVELEK